MPEPKFRPPRTRESLPPEGEAIAEIIDVQRKTSKAGNAMVEMTYLVPIDGKQHKVRDWLVGDWGKDKAEAIRIALQRDSEGFRLSGLIGARMYVRIEHQEPQGTYGWSARIGEYMEPGPSGPPPAEQPKEALPDGFPY
jgi:hypothetical protein